MVYVVVCSLLFCVIKRCKLHCFAILFLKRVSDQPVCPLLPKNPQLADWLIAHALEQKYGKEVQLAPLDDTEEKAANDYVYHRFVKEN